jgi:hypothetical protein
MTDAQFRRALLELGLHTQKEAAKVLGLNPRTVLRHSQAGKPSPHALSLTTERLIWMLQKHGIPKEFR